MDDYEFFVRLAELKMTDALRLATLATVYASSNMQLAAEYRDRSDMLVVEADTIMDRVQRSVIR